MKLTTQLRDGILGTIGGVWLTYLYASMAGHLSSDPRLKFDSYRVPPFLDPMLIGLLGITAIPVTATILEVKDQLKTPNEPLKSNTPKL